MENKRIIRIDHAIYPDFDEFSLPELKKKLGEFGVEVEFLFDGGIQFNYDKELIQVKPCPADISFYRKGSNWLYFTVTEVFDKILIYKGDENFFTIPIMEETKIKI